MCLQIYAIFFSSSLRYVWKVSEVEDAIALQRNQFPEIPTNPNPTLLWHFREEILNPHLGGSRGFSRSQWVSQVSEWIVPIVEVCVCDKWNITHKIIEFPYVHMYFNGLH